jgi:DNA-binding helix-hairpin-helix protein with protein kinase domain
VTIAIVKSWPLPPPDPELLAPPELLQAANAIVATATATSAGNGLRVLLMRALLGGGSPWQATADLLGRD